MRAIKASVDLALGGALFIIVAIIPHLSTAQPLVTDPAPEPSSKSVQPVDERRFADVALEKVEWIHDPHPHLLNPMQMKVYDGRLYVWDEGHEQFKVFELNGRFVGALGNGRGQGPGELQSVMDFYVRDGRVWLLDGRQRRISVFNANSGSFIKQISLNSEGPPNRIAPFGEQIIVRQLAPTSLFLKVDTTGQVLERFGPMDDFMTRFGERNPLAFGGYLMTTGSNIVYGASTASYLHFFDTGGRMTRTVETIDQQPYDAPDGRQGKRGMRFRPPSPPIQYRAFTIQGDTLKMNAADYENRRAIIDYYTADGQYLESVLLPEPATVAYPYRGTIITVHEATLTKYRVVR